MFNCGVWVTLHIVPKFKWIASRMGFALKKNPRRTYVTTTQAVRLSISLEYIISEAIICTLDLLNIESTNGFALEIVLYQALMAKTTKKKEEWTKEWTYRFVLSIN